MQDKNKMFECSKKITFESVKKYIDEIISENSKYMFYCNCNDGTQKKLNLYELTTDFSWENDPCQPLPFLSSPPLGCWP